MTHYLLLAGAMIGFAAAMTSAAEEQAVKVPPVAPFIDGDWWTVATDPDLGDRNDPRQQAVDFSIWQAADGTWQIWSCIRHGKVPGHQRLLHRWEGQKLTDTNWKAMGVAMEADPSLGEQVGGLQAPHVIRDDAGQYVMFYGDWEYICRALSTDGKTFNREIQANGKTGIFTELPLENTRDPMVIKINGLWHCYYTVHREGIKGAPKLGWAFVRTSTDLKNWGPSSIVAAGGKRGGFGMYSAECPHVYFHKATGDYFFFRTQRYGASAVTSVYRSKSPFDFGIDFKADEQFVCTLPIAAPELFEHEGQLYIAALLPSLNGIQVAKLGWK